MGKYSVPEDIRKLKPKGTIVKKIHNKYYVYEHFNRKIENKWKTKNGKLLGYIDENKGFIPNKTFINNENATTYEYGQYALVVNNSTKTLERLLEFFNPKDAYCIYLIAVIYTVNGFVPLKNINLYYEMSYLSIIHKDINLSYYILSNLLDALGRKQTRVFSFEQSLIDECSKEIAIDGHDIMSTSHENDLAQIGNKFNTMQDMQLNVLMAYDINTNTPLVSRVYPGSVLDKSSVSDLLGFNNYHDILFIIDRGFYSESNIKLFSENNNHYIIPLSSNLTSYKEATKDMKLTDIFVYERSKKISSIEYKEIKLENKKIIVFRDLNQNAIDKAKFLKNMESNPKKYTQDKFNEVKDFFGVIVLQTNLDKSVEEIFQLYKKRWTIETFFNYFKNDIDINALGINDYYSTQGLTFIMLIVGLIHQELTNNLKKIKGKSVDDCLLEARFAKLNYKCDNYFVSKVKTSTLDLLKDLNVDVQSPLDIISNISCT